MGTILTALANLNWAAFLPWIIGGIGVVWGYIMHLSGKKATAEADAKVTKVQAEVAVQNAIVAQKTAEAKVVAVDATKAAQAVPDDALDAALKAEGALRE
jgi:hypothetical protein